MKLHNNLDFRKFEAQNVKAQNLGGDPSLGTSDAGLFWFDTVLGRHRGWDGSAAQTLTNIIETVVGDGTIGAALAGKQVTVSIPAATAAIRGTMSAADKAKLDAAASANTASALVQRDANGDFAAGNITAHLVGLADNATLLGGQSLAQVRDFSQTTGQRTSRSALSDIDAVIQGTRLDQLTAPTGPVSLNNQRLTNGADPTQAQDLATKNYVDSVATGLDAKPSVRAATTAALPSCTYANGTAGVGATLTATANAALAAQDGVTLTAGQRLLVKNQASNVQNGIYVVTQVGSGSLPFILTRATDADQAAEVTPGMFTFVEEGTALAKTGWVLTSTGATTVGTTGLPFTQFSGAGTYLAGSGLSLTGSTFAAVGTANRISVGSTIDIAATYVGQSSITTVGTIGTGVWQGTPVAVAYGGTGATTAAGARANLGATTKVAGNVPALAAGATYDLVHNLGTTDVLPMLQEVATGDYFLADLKAFDANTVRLTSGSAIAANAFRIIVVG